MKRSFDEYLNEAIDAGWWTGTVAPLPDERRERFLEIWQEFDEVEHQVAGLASRVSCDRALRVRRSSAREPIAGSPLLGEVAA